VATISPQGQVIRIVHVDRTAALAGVRPGQTLADAKALVPELVTYEDDPLADRRQLESLAILGGNLAPTVHIEGDDTLIVDITGCERLYDGEENILRRAVDLFRERGHSVRCAIADTLGAAWALAHAHPQPAVITEPGQTPADLAPLPVWSLRIDAPVVDKLATVGVLTIGSLFHLPRSSLTSRFGETLLERMDQALGDVPEVLRPYHPETVLTSRLALGAPTDRLDVLVTAVRRVLETFCHRLEQRVGGVRQVFVTFYCPDVVVDRTTEARTVTVEVNLSRPTRSAKHLFSLFTVRLDALALPGPADMLMIWSREIEPLDDWQTELFATDASDPKELGALLDRLAVRLSPAAVVRAVPVSDHQPEKAFQYVTLVGRPDGAKAVAAMHGGVALGRGTRRAPLQTASLDPAGDGASRGTLPSAVREADPTSLRRGACPDEIGVASSLASVDPLACARGSDSPVAEGMKNGSAHLHSRPLRLLFNPLEIQATALAPEGPPITFRLRSVSHQIADCIGPERIETGWWRGPHVQRDYYRVLTDTGRRAWIFRRRDTNAWFLHGWFD